MMDHTYYYNRASNRLAFHLFSYPANVKQTAVTASKLIRLAYSTRVWAYTRRWKDICTNWHHYAGANPEWCQVGLFWPN